MRSGCGWRRCRPRPWRCGSSLPRPFQLLPARRAEPTRGGSAAGAARPRALEASDDLAVLGDLRELLDPAADVSDIQAVTLTGHDALDVHDVLRTARHALVDNEILGRAKSHAAALSHVVGDGAGNRLFLEAGQGQAQIGRARARHVDRQDAVLEGEGDGVLQTRRKRRGNFTEASLLSAGGQQDREIDIDRQTRLAPALDGDATDDHVGDVALGEETMQLPGRFELAVHRLPASRRRSATRCSMARRSSAAPRSRGRACHISTRRSYWARASATLRVRSSRSLRSRRKAWPRPLRALGPALGRIAGDGAHVRGYGDLQELEVPRRRRLVVPQAARDVERLARLDTQFLAVLELEVDPSAEHVHELALADVVVPSRWLRHPLGPDRDLGADLPAARGRDAEVAVLEEGAPARH